MSKKTFGTSLIGSEFLKKSQIFISPNILEQSLDSARRNKLIWNIDLEEAKISVISQDDKEIKITFFSFTDSEKLILKEIFIKNPLYLHSVISGNIPAELLKLMEEHGLPIFENLYSSCDCSKNISITSLSSEARRLYENMIQKNMKLAESLRKGIIPQELIESVKQKNIRLLEHTNPIYDIYGDLVGIEKMCDHIGTTTFKVAGMLDKDPMLFFKIHGFDIEEYFNLNFDDEINSPINLEIVKTKSKFEVSENLKIIKFKDYRHFILSMLSDNPDFAKINYKVILTEFYNKQKFNLLQIVSPMNLAEIDNIKRAINSSKILFILTKKSHYGIFRVTNEMFAQDNNILHVLNYFGKPISDDNDDNSVKVAGFDFEPISLFKLFISFEEESGSESFRYLFYMFRIAYMLIESGGFIPAVLPMSDTIYKIIYRPLISVPEIREQIEVLSKFMPKIVIFSKKYTTQLSGTEWMLSSVITAFVMQMDFKQKKMPKRIPEISMAFFQGKDIHRDKTHRDAISKARAISKYFSIFDTSSRNYSYRLKIEKRDNNYSVAFFAVSKKDEQEELRIDEISELNEKFEIYSFLNIIQTRIKGIEDLINTGEIILTPKKLKVLILETVDQLSNLDISIIMPKELKTLLKPKLALNVRKKGNNSINTFLDLSSILEYDWKIAIGDEVISVEEFEKLVQSGEQFVQFRDSFVVISTEEAKKIFDQIKRHKKLSTLDMLRAKWGGNLQISKELSASIDQILSPKEITQPTNLVANLRNYQLRGFQWATTNLLNGFGVIIADDMGLGKTIQAITTIIYLKSINELKRGTLVIVPTSLLNNWEKEVSKFAPDLTFYTYYGTKREFNNVDIIFTTYSLLVRDIDKLNSFNFDTIIIDEAQKIKNPETATTLAVKSLKAKFKIALSGTPVENNLSELWSIFDFVMPTYLGSLADFRKDYADQIELHLDKDRLENLRKITAPFMLRRLKSDKNIVSDLPDKIVIDEFASMTKEQASLYQGAINESFKRMAESNNNAVKKGELLKLITSLKQICNHPRNFDRESQITSSLSGKSLLLMTLLETILERGEKVLIFSQYAEMVDILSEMMKLELSITPLVLKGSMTKIERDDVIEQFNVGGQYSILILSLRAGGVGLNLTNANHVIHYDLWFNPAVENQATDRAFRIGQDKNVTVYRLITKGSFEEKIDKMIKSKQELSNLSLSAGESWLSNLDEDELKELFKANIS